MQKPIFAFDFSCSKPAVCFSDPQGAVAYACFPADADPDTVAKLEAAGVETFPRGLNPLSKGGMTNSEMMTEQVGRAGRLAESITDWCMGKLAESGLEPSQAIVAHEGLSFGSKGNATLDLAGYKYVLMDRMIAAGFMSFVTYAPITIKKTAGCSRKGMGKEDMVQAAAAAYDTRFNRRLKDEPMSLKKKTAWVHCVDDLCDAYWCLRTCLEKERISDDQ